MGAAFFDLDRTLLPGASGPTIAAALRNHGVLGPRTVPGERVAFGLFNLLGENLPSILATRQGARAARGWSVHAVRRAAKEVVEPLIDQIKPYAWSTIEEHRQAGRKLVLATTTPYDLVAPLAEQLGFDDVLATRYRVASDPGPDGPMYDGTIDGEFVWSTGKARSVTVWARANQVELAHSHAYSDSIFDVPMLSRVGHPVAVNPDPRLLAYAAARGWPRVWFDAPPGVPKPAGIELQNLLGRLARPQLLPWVRIELSGEDNLPAAGPAVMAANHRSYLDPALVAYAGARLDRPVRFMAKQELFDVSLVGPLIRSLGAIPVDRTGRGQRSMAEAASALRAGELIAVFPQGTIPRGPAFEDRTLTGRTGAVRLARETGSPLVPIGLWGTEAAWPRSSRVPYLLNLADPPVVSIRIGEPYHPGDEEPAAATNTLMARIAELLPA